MYLIEIQHLKHTKTSYITGAHILRCDLLFKWMTVIIGNDINEYYKNTKSSDHMMIYSINADNALIDELSNAISAIIDKESGKNTNLPGLRSTYYEEFSFISVNNISDSLYKNFYEFNAANQKIYEIKLFDLEMESDFSQGIPIAYLYCKTQYMSLGYLGYIRSFGKEGKYVFISVNEKLGFCIYTDIQFEFFEFKLHEFQSLYFILEILHFLHSLNFYKIKLIDMSFTFSVDRSDNKKWGFRLKDIGSYCYVENVNIYENYEFLVLVIDNLLPIIKDSNMLEFFCKFKAVLKKLKNSSDQKFIEALTKMLEDKIKEIENL